MLGFVEYPRVCPVSTRRASLEYASGLRPVCSGIGQAVVGMACARGGSAQRGVLCRSVGLRVA
jgi:hypothetical protein